MQEVIEFIAKYGVLKYNIFGKKTNKINKIIDVKTNICFTDEEIIINLYGIDRNNGQGLHNEKNIFKYEDIERIEIDEGLGSFNIIMKDNTTQIINDTKYLSKKNNTFILDKKYLKDFYILLKKIKKYGFLDLEDLE